MANNPMFDTWENLPRETRVNPILPPKPKQGVEVEERPVASSLAIRRIQEWGANPNVKIQCEHNAGGHYITEVLIWMCYKDGDVLTHRYKVAK